MGLTFFLDRNWCLVHLTSLCKCMEWSSQSSTAGCRHVRMEDFLPGVIGWDRNRGAACCANSGTPGQTGAAVPSNGICSGLCPSDTQLCAALIYKVWVCEALSSYSFHRACGLGISASQTDPSSVLLRGRSFALISSPDVAAVKTNVGLFSHNGPLSRALQRSQVTGLA